MINNRNLTVLVVAAAASVAVTAALYSGKPAAGAFQAGTPLIQGLAPEKIHSILITKGKESVTLTAYEREAAKGKEKERGYQLAERDNYPAANSRINQLILNVMDIRCKEKVTDSKSNYADLGVADDSPDAVIVRFRDADGKSLIGFIKGKSVEGGSGSYVRLLDQPTVYATDNYLSIDTTPASFLDKTLIQVKREDETRVAVQTGKDQYAITKGEKDALTLSPVPEGKRAKDSALSDVFGALSNFDFTDVTPAAKLTLEWDATYTCTLNSGLVYTVKLAKKDDKHYAQVSAVGPNVTSVTISKTEGDAELKKKEALLLAADTAKAFTPRHAGWVYQIQSWTAERLRKPLADLVEDLPKPDDEVTASHILISYKGAMRSTATRTKEEAQKLADEVLAKVKAPDADFAALAKQYSDDASNKEKGGDLGTFKKGVMDKAFEAAAWALKPGEISGVVETPFGFHIIKRTK